MEREPRGTGSLFATEYKSSMAVTLFERDLGTAPNPPDWNVWCISLDTYPANLSKNFSRPTDSRHT